MNKHRCNDDWLGFAFILIGLLTMLPSSVNAGYWKEDITEDFTSIADWTCTDGTCLTNGSFYGSDANGNIIMRNFSLDHTKAYNITADFWYISSSSNYISIFFYKEITDAFKHAVLTAFTTDVVNLYNDGAYDSQSAYTMNHVTPYRISWLIYPNKTTDVWINGVLRHTDTTFMNLTREDDFIGLMVRDNTPTYTEYIDNFVLAYWFNPSLTLNTNFVNNTNVTNYQTHTIPITYNGTITDTSSIFNCSLFNNTNLIERDLDVNLSQLQYFTLNTSNFTGTYSKLVIDCNNTETSFATGGYRYNIDTVFTLTYTEQALTDINANLTLIYEVLEMIPIVILYLGLLFFSYWLMQTGNTLTGWFFYFSTVGFDFLISGLLYDSYFSLIDNTISGMLVTGFFVFLVGWIIFKFLSLTIIKARTKFI